MKARRVLQRVDEVLSSLRKIEESRPDDPLVQIVQHVFSRYGLTTNKCDRVAVSSS